MDVLIAIAHIGGSIVAVVVFGMVVLLIGAWETERNQRHALEDASIQLGVAVEDLDNEELAPKLIQLSSSRYSRELLRNRLSDLCGALRTVWGWFGLLLQCAILVGVVWYTFTDSLRTAVHAWWIVAVAVVFLDNGRRVRLGLQTLYRSLSWRGEASSKIARQVR